MGALQNIWKWSASPKQTTQKSIGGWVILVLSWHIYNYFIGTSRKKNALKFAYLRKAILFLESEIDLLKLTLPQVRQSPGNLQSNIYFIPKREGLCLDGMGEFVVSFELSGQFFDGEGKPAPLILISETLERAFNFSFGDIYKSKKRIFSRKPYNLTKAFDYLKNLIMRENRNRIKSKDEKR